MEVPIISQTEENDIVHATWKSSSFRRGFSGGFTSMFRLVAPHKRSSYRHYDTVAVSWHEIGALLSEASSIEGRRIEQQAGKTAKSKEFAAG